MTEETSDSAEDQKTAPAQFVLRVSTEQLIVVSTDLEILG